MQYGFFEGFSENHHPLCSGLAAAHYLRKLPQTKSVTVLESAARLGGWVETTR